MMNELISLDECFENIYQPWMVYIVSRIYIGMSLNNITHILKVDAIFNVVKYINDHAFQLGLCTNIMMTLSNGNIFGVTGALYGELTGHRWIPLTKASDAELWCFLWSAPEHPVK